MRHDSGTRQIPPKFFLQVTSRTTTLSRHEHGRTSATLSSINHLLTHPSCSLRSYKICTISCCRQQHQILTSSRLYGVSFFRCSFAQPYNCHRCRQRLLSARTITRIRHASLHYLKLLLPLQKQTYVMHSNPHTRCMTFVIRFAN